MEQWILDLVNRHAARQKADARLPWPEKLRISMQMQEDLRGFPREKRVRSPSPAARETLAVLEEEELVKKLKRSIKEADEGKLVPLEEVDEKPAG